MIRILLALACLGAAVRVDAAEIQLQPAELSGLAAFHVLSATWVVAVVDTHEAVVAAMDARTDGEYGRCTKRWRDTAESANPDWNACKKMEELRARWWGAARADAGETTLDLAGRWVVVGPERNGRPLRLTRAAVGIDGGSTALGEGLVRYATYVYMELPQACVEGGDYVLRLDGRDVARWRWAGDHTLSRAIKVNQVGYRPGDPLRVGYVGGWLQDLGPLPIADGLEFSLVDAATGEVACTGPVTLRDEASAVPPKPDAPADPQRVAPLLTGERVYECDFSACDKPGRYFLRIPGIGRSWTFPIAPDVYGEAFYISMRGLFHQRGSFALKTPYTAWQRPRFHAAPVYESAQVLFPPNDPGAPKGYERFDVIGASIDTTRSTKDVVGGWYDAADYDRNCMHYTVLADLLELFEARPGVFTDGQLNLPESGNGIPDLLDEAEFGLRVWLRSQDDRGAVAGMVETSTHPPITDTTHQWAFSRRTRYTTLLFAAAAAQYARLVRPYSKDLAWTYTTAARKALTFGADPGNNAGLVRIPARRDRGRGEAYSYEWTETDEPLVPFLLAAKLQCFLNDNDELVLLGLADLMGKIPYPGIYPFAVTDHSPWMPLPLLVQMERRFPPSRLRKLGDHYKARAAELVSYTDGMPYRMTWPRHQDYWMSWGATVMTNHNRFLFAADRIKPEPARLRAVLANAAAMFGCNPLGMSWTTGIGECYPVVLQHEWSEKDGIDDPMPGITLYGVTEGTYKQLREEVWGAADGAGGTVSFTRAVERPVWRRWSPHPTLNTPQCEFTVHETMASTILTCGMLMPAGWMPSSELRQRGPRSAERLYGRWYVP